MLVTRGLAADGNASPAALTIGNFDGVHRGHQAMVSRVIDAARNAGLVPTVLTFEPHPREFFSSQTAPARLTTVREKLELLDELGVERTHVQHFSRAFASLAPEAFVEGVLVRAIKAQWILVGDDFRFGAKRAGDVQLLEESARPYGFAVERMPTVACEGVRVSSSAVREALARGALDEARALLGRPYSMSGRVVRGAQLGREIGFPTANVQMKRNRPPLLGVYVVRVYGVDANPLPGVASLGYRPTIGDDLTALLEVHLFDFEGDLYRRHLRVEFLHKLRDEEKYPDVKTLQRAIARDCDAARDYLSTVNA